MANPIPETVMCPLCASSIPNVHNSEVPQQAPGSGHNSVTTAFAGDTPAARVKQEIVVRVMRRGGSFADAAREAGYADKGGAYKAWKSAIERYPSKSIAEARDLQDQRLDRLLELAWAKAEAGDLGGVHAAIRVEERRARLHGLDHADGVAERLVQIEADKVRLMKFALAAALTELGFAEADQENARRVFMRHLRALPAAGEEAAG